MTENICSAYFRGSEGGVFRGFIEKFRRRRRCRGSYKKFAQKAPKIVSQNASKERGTKHFGAEEGAKNNFSLFKMYSTSLTY